MESRKPNGASPDDRTWSGIRLVLEEMRDLRKEFTEFRKEAAEDRKRYAGESQRWFEQAAKDRSQAAEDRRQATEDRRQIAELYKNSLEDSARRERELRDALVVIGKVGRQILKNQEGQTKVLEGMTKVLEDIKYAVTPRRNGKHGNGNGGYSS